MNVIYAYIVLLTEGVAWTEEEEVAQASAGRREEDQRRASGGCKHGSFNTGTNEDTATVLQKGLQDF